MPSAHQTPYFKLFGMRAVEASTGQRNAQPRFAYFRRKNKHTLWFRPLRSLRMLIFLLFWSILYPIFVFQIRFVIFFRCTVHLAFAINTKVVNCRSPLDCNSATNTTKQGRSGCQISKIVGACAKSIIHYCQLTAWHRFWLEVKSYSEVTRHYC